jgi:hypothetical protein
MTNTNTTADLVAQRIGSSLENWNSWPDLELVGVREIDMTDPVEAHLFGYLEGSSAQYRQVRATNLPHDVARRLERWGTKYFLVQTRFTLATERGQLDDAETRNIYALIGAKKEYDFKTRKMHFTTPALCIELGCDHDYAVTTPYRCGTHGDCKKCGHTWEVDSGD